MFQEFPEIEELPTTDHFIIVSVDYSKEGADSVLFQSTDLENIIYDVILAKKLFPCIIFIVSIIFFKL